MYFKILKDCFSHAFCKKYTYVTDKLEFTLPFGYTYVTGKLEFTIPLAFWPFG